MMGGGKAGKPTAQEAARFSSLRVQTSNYGSPWTLLFGTQRIAPKLIDYDDFLAIPHTSVQSVGGKGGGTKSVTSTTYTYQAAVILALCEGMIQGVLQVWDYKGVSSSTPGVETWALTSTPITVTNAATWLYDVGVALLTSVSVWVEDAYYYGGGSVGDSSQGHYEVKTQATPMTKVGSSPAAGQYSVAAGVYTFNAADVGIGKSVRISYRAASAVASGTSPVGAFGLTLFNGSSSQSAWSYMTTKHPTKALAYRNRAYVANAALDLGTSSELPQYSLEVVGLAVATGKTLDANLADILPLLLCDPRFSVGLASSALGDLSLARTYVDAAGLYISPMLDGQRSTAEVMVEILRATNCAAVWSEGVLKIIPYGERPIVGNGATYTPNTTPIYDLTVDDFICEAGTAPITIEVADDKDIKNKRSLEFLNRAQNYNTEPVDLDDRADVEVYGLREEDIEAFHCVTEKDVALQVLSNILNRGLFTEPYKFKFALSWKYVRLECMDLVTLAVPELNMVRVPVRITSIEESEDGVLAFEAEPFAFGTATATLYPKQLASGATIDRLVAPGSANAPLIFEVPDSLSESQGLYEVKMAVSGSSPNWGGASVWVSEDNATYKLAGQVFGSARMGVLQALLASHADPDTVDTLSVDLTESVGVLLSGTAADRDAARTLMYVHNVSTGYGEFISYQTATLTATSKYDLTSLRRGLFGSPIQAFASSAPCCRYDDALFSHFFDERAVGKTLYVKLTSFNIYGLAEQSLADVSATSFVLNGAFNNFGTVIGTDATVDNIGAPGGGPFTSATVRAYGVGGVGTTITLKKADGTTTTMPAISISGLALSTLYYLMFKKADGTSYVVSTYSAMIAACANGDINLGQTKTVDAAGSGGTSGGGGGGFGGGGGNGCCCVEMYVEDSLAGDLSIGEYATCLDVSSETRRGKPLLRRGKNKFAYCVRLVAANGAVWEGSADTPFSLPDGRSVRAGLMSGELMATDNGEGTALVWSSVTVADIGMREVAPLDFGGEVFGASVARGAKRCYSHNINKVL